MKAGEFPEGAEKMDCLAVYDSGNYTIKMCRYFERKGLVFEVISLPCRISSQGCGYCLKFPEEYLKDVLAGSREMNYSIRELFRVNKGFMKNTYEKLPLHF